MAKPVAIAASISQSTSPAVLLTSRLFGTSPFLRASLSRFGVGFSVLSPPSFLSDMVSPGQARLAQQVAKRLDRVAAALQQGILQQLHERGQLDQNDPYAGRALERHRQ